MGWWMGTRAGLSDLEKKNTDLFPAMINVFVTLPVERRLNEETRVN
jgi:hypothetical protein